MGSYVRPMFPLGTVLMPGGSLPLRVFEPRYRQLVADLSAPESPGEFGVVLIERGFEVGGGDQRSAVGAIAQLVRSDRLPDGTFALESVGTRRIRVCEWLADDPYPRAVVEDWPDAELTDVAAALALADAARDRLRALGELVRSAGYAVDAIPDRLGDDPEMTSFELCRVAPVGPADAHALLAATDALARCDLLIELLGGVEEVIRFRLGPNER